MQRTQSNLQKTRCHSPNFFCSFHAIKISAITGILKLTNKFQDFAVWNRMQPVRIACS